jgi:hypothetical protein
VIGREPRVSLTTRYEGEPWAFEQRYLANRDLRADHVPDIHVEALDPDFGESGSVSE